MKYCTLLLAVFLAPVAQCMHIKNWASPEHQNVMDAINRNDLASVVASPLDMNFKYKLLSNGRIQTPLSLAVGRGFYSMIGALLAKGSRLDPHTIQEAQRLQDTRIISLLNSYFKHSDIPVPPENTASNYQAIDNELARSHLNSLLAAVDNEHFDINTPFTQLSTDGFGTPLTVHGTTLFIEAASRGQVDMMEFLRQHGADIYATTTNGWTALHAAATQGQSNAITYLLELTKDRPDFVHTRDLLTGATALTIAQYFNKAKVFALIQKHLMTTPRTTL